MKHSLKKPHWSHLCRKNEEQTFGVTLSNDDGSIFLQMCLGILQPFLGFLPYSFIIDTIKCLNLCKLIKEKNALLLDSQ